MPKEYKTPGVYIKEMSSQSPGIAQVETAIPAFIGYTEKAISGRGGDLTNVPTRISTLAEYQKLFGNAFKESFSLEVKLVNGVYVIANAPIVPKLIYYLYYSLEMYFLNGGGPCYIISVSQYDAANPVIDPARLSEGLNILANEDEPTLILFPDAVAISGTSRNPQAAEAQAFSYYYNLYAAALAQCATLQDRFTIVDVFCGDQNYRQTGGPDIINDSPNSIRSGIGNQNLKYGAAYYPWLETILSFAYDPSRVLIVGYLNKAKEPIKLVLRDDKAGKANSLFHLDQGFYLQLKAEIEQHKVVLPPGAILAGIYAMVDRDRGVWKAPANVSLSGVLKPIVKINEPAQEGLNVHSSGKSVNAIRSFRGQGVLVWGGRTLAGNDNEWRFVSVRRFFNMVEESVKKASLPFVFEPNDANTWLKLRLMIEEYLISLWRQGALSGAKPEEGFFVNVGLGKTMTAQDILEGLMIVEIGMAVARPAEFIVFSFTQKMQEP